eukprot:3795810-Prymnesium_polylepis.2
MSKSGSNNPSDFLKTVLGRPVVVKLNSGVDYRGAHDAPCRCALCDAEDLSACCRCVAGVLACLDGYMNIAMEQTEEYVNGQLKAKYGDTFIRGNNGAAGHRPSQCYATLTANSFPSQCSTSARRRNGDECSPRGVRC